MMMIRASLAVLAVFAAAACAEATREFSAPPTLTPTTPPAVPSTPRPATPAPSTAAPTAAPTTAAPTTAAPTSAAPSPTRTGSATPARTATASAQPTLPPGASLPPMPSQPPLQNATLIASGTSSFALPAGRTVVIDAADLARSRGASPSPNATLAWTIAWRATEPLTSSWYRLSARNELGRGRWGTADLGNATFELRNDSAATVYGEFAYLIGTR